MNFTDLFASWKLLQFFDDGPAVKEKFVANDGVTRGHDQASLGVDLTGVRIGGVGGPDNRHPMLANDLLRSFETDAVFEADIANKVRYLPNGAAARVSRILAWDASQ